MYTCLDICCLMDLCRKLSGKHPGVGLLGHELYAVVILYSVWSPCSSQRLYKFTPSLPTSVLVLADIQLSTCCQTERNKVASHCWFDLPIFITREVEQLSTEFSALQFSLDGNCQLFSFASFFFFFTRFFCLFHVDFQEFITYFRWQSFFLFYTL